MLKDARHAFITGGASGIGLGIADYLVELGLDVTIADIDEQVLDAVVAERGAAFGGLVLDTRDRGGWAEARAEAETVFGPVDILVNNAGIAPDGREFADMDPASFDRILAINLVGIFNGVSAFAAAMRERGRGHIVNTASMAGLAPRIPGIGAYSVAKSGVIAMTETLREEMAPHGVGVSVLCPGLVATNLAETTRKVGGQLREGSENAPMQDSGVSTVDVATMVAEAIEQNRPYIITHPDAWPGVERRMQVLKEAFNQ